jgi:hypothetical protein
VTANEIYNSLLNDIANAVEVFTCIKEYKPDLTRKAADGLTHAESVERSLQGDVGIFGSKLHLLKELIRDHCGIELPGTNSKQDLIDYLHSFQQNKDAIITGFETIIGHPEKAYQWGFNDFTTYESMLLDRVKYIKQESEYIRLQFEKLIQLIDSDMTY